jgi:hypothetical protein
LRHLFPPYRIRGGEGRTEPLFPGGDNLLAPFQAIGNSIDLHFIRIELAPV